MRTRWAVALGVLLCLTACRMTAAPPRAAADPGATALPATDPAQVPLGLLALELDLAALALTVEPVMLGERRAMGELEAVHLNPFLTGCRDCLTVDAIHREPDGRVVLTVGLRHPFPVGDPALPPSATNRLDLHVFTPQVMLLGEAVGGTVDFPTLGQAASTPRLVNPDGYSADLAPALTTALGFAGTLAPYKAFFRDYTIGNFDAVGGFADLQVPTGTCVMPMGSAVDQRQFELRLPAAGTWRCHLAAQATWQQGIDRLAPIYRCPQAARKAANEVVVRVVSNGLQAGEPTSFAQLEVGVLDLNADSPVGSGLGEVDFASVIAELAIEAPGLLASALTITDPIPTGGDPRDPLNPLTFAATIPNSAAASVGEYLALIRVRDAYPAAEAGLGPDGVDAMLAPGPQGLPFADSVQLSVFATFALVPLTVAPAGCPSAPVFTAATPPNPILGVAYSYQFVATGGQAPLTFSLLNGTLPTGLTLMPDGTLSGQASERDEFFTPFPVTIQVADSCVPPQTATVDRQLDLQLQPLTIVEFKIGYGMATLVYAANGEALLVDSGPPNTAVAQTIRDTIINRGLTLKYIVGTHFHDDHTGNVGGIIAGPDGQPGVAGVDDDGDGSADNPLDAEEYGWPGSDDLMPLMTFDNGNDDIQNTMASRVFRAATSRWRVPWSTALLGDQTLMTLDEPGLELWLAAGNRATFTGGNPGRSTSDENANSIVLVLQHGGFDTELGGDLNQVASSLNTEQTLATSFAGIGFGLDYMHAHHHGNSDAGGAPWLSGLEPETILIQTGGSSGVPHQALLDRIQTILYDPDPRILDHLYLTEMGTTLPRSFAGVPLASSPVVTIANGDVTLVTDGREYTITTPQGSRTIAVD